MGFHPSACCTSLGLRRICPGAALSREGAIQGWDEDLSSPSRLDRTSLASAVLERGLDFFWGVGQFRGWERSFGWRRYCPLREIRDSSRVGHLLIRSAGVIFCRGWVWPTYEVSALVWMWACVCISSAWLCRAPRFRMDAVFRLHLVCMAVSGSQLWYGYSDMYRLACAYQTQ